MRRRLGLAAARAVRREWLYSRIVQKMKAVYAEAMTFSRLVSPRVLPELLITNPNGKYVAL
jgi:hypothetical protein